MPNPQIAAAAITTTMPMIASRNRLRFLVAQQVGDGCPEAGVSAAIVRIFLRGFRWIKPTSDVYPRIWTTDMIEIISST